MDSMTLDEAVNKFKKFDNDLPKEFRIFRQDIINGDVRKINKAYRILAMKYHPDRNSSPESEEKFKEMKSSYEFLIEEAEYYKETKKVGGVGEVRREEHVRNYEQGESEKTEDMGNKIIKWKKIYDDSEEQERLRLKGGEQKYIGSGKDLQDVVKALKEGEAPKEPLQLGSGPKQGEYSPMIRPGYTGTSKPKDEGPVITPQPKKPLQLGPEVSEPNHEPSTESKPEKKQKTQKTKVPLIPLLQFFAFLLGIYLLLFTPYWIFGLPLVIAGILLLVGVQSEREGLRELFDWFLNDPRGNKWGMVLVVGIGSLIVYFQLGPIIAAIPLLVIVTYFAFGKKVVGKGHFVEYVLGLSGATIVLYYFFGYYVATIPVLLMLVSKIFGKTALGEHFIEFIMTGTGIVLFIGGAQYAASYLYVTFSWPLLAGFGLFNTVVLILFWSMEEGEGNAEKDKAQTEEAKAATKYYESMQNRQGKNLEDWEGGAEKEKLKAEKEAAEAEKETAKVEKETAEAESAKEKNEN